MPFKSREETKAGNDGANIVVLVILYDYVNAGHFFFLHHLTKLAKMSFLAL